MKQPKPSTQERINSSSASEINKRLILQWYEYLVGQGLTQDRVDKLIYQIIQITECAKKDYPSMEIADISKILYCINTCEKHSEATKVDYKRGIKQFFNWYKLIDTTHGMNFYEYVTKHIKRGNQRKTIRPHEIITDEDLQVILEKGCRWTIEKAFLMLLHETGMRANEILKIRLCDIEAHDTHWNITVDGKTGMRTVPIIKSIPYLTEWLKRRENNDPKQVIWDNERISAKYSTLQRSNAAFIVRNCMFRAGVDKPNNLHHFRHSRASINAQHMTEQVLCRFMGWSLGSQQVRTYVHLSNRQIEEAVIGMQKKNERQVTLVDLFH